MLSSWISYSISDKQPYFGYKLFDTWIWSLTIKLLDDEQVFLINQWETRIINSWPITDQEIEPPCITFIRSPKSSDAPSGVQLDAKILIMNMKSVSNNSLAWLYALRKQMHKYRSLWAFNHAEIYSWKNYNWDNNKSLAEKVQARTLPLTKNLQG